MKRAAPEVWDCVGQVVEALGFEFVGVRYGQEEGVPSKSLDLVRAPFEHMASGLAASDVRQR